MLVKHSSGRRRQSAIQSQISVKIQRDQSGLKSYINYLYLIIKYTP